MPHFTKFSGKSKFDPYLYSLNFSNNSDTNYVSYYRVACG